MDAVAPGLWSPRHSAGSATTSPETVRRPDEAALGARDRPPHIDRLATRGLRTFQPTFLNELIFDLALAAIRTMLGRTGLRAPGLFALYVAGYSGFRIFEGLLRVDPSHHILG